MTAAMSLMEGDHHLFFSQLYFGLVLHIIHLAQGQFIKTVVL